MANLDHSYCILIHNSEKIPGPLTRNQIYGLPTRSGGGGDRELNLRRREYLKPDLNAQFASFCTSQGKQPEVIIATRHNIVPGHVLHSLAMPSHILKSLFFFGKGLLPQENRGKSINTPFHLGGKLLNCIPQVGCMSGVNSIIGSDASFEAGQLQSCFK